MTSEKEIDWTAIKIAEYEARRGEILFRLNCMQRAFEQSIITTGIVVTILGLFNQQILDIFFILSILLVSPIIFLFLQVSYLKHHYWLLVNASYQERKIALDIENNGITSPNNIFSGYGKYVDFLHKQGVIQVFYFRFLGFLEAAFPTVMGLSNLLLFWILAINHLNQLNHSIWVLFLLIIGVLEIIPFVFLLTMGIFQRFWAEKNKIFQTK
ncbi:MAG: hypothetical protein JEZ00_18150 [Anaerolineaceae bacterium]|nr:hypothetical protein [Anaerolineaceae bacterium]